MLRALVLLLVLANLAVLAWNQGWLASVVGRPGDTDREPERVARQVHPEAVTVLRDQDARSALADAERQARAATAAASATAPAASAPVSAPASAPASAVAETAPPMAAAASTPASTPSSATAPSTVTVATCLQAGPLTPAELAATDRSLRALQMPALRWVPVRTEKGGLFIVYMGRYADRDSLQRKQEELRRLGVPFAAVADAPTLMPGLELGRYRDRTEANAALAQAAQRGVKSARVAMLVAPELLTHLRAERLDRAQSDRLQALVVAPAAPRFKPCPPASAPGG